MGLDEDVSLEVLGLLTCDILSARSGSSSSHLRIVTEGVEHYIEGEGELLWEREREEAMSAGVLSCLAVLVSVDWGGKETGRTYQSTGAVDAGIACPDAGEPLRLSKLPKTVFGHVEGSGRGSSCVVESRIGQIG